MMFRSIRWRLVISYVLLALLIVSSIGILGLWGVKRYTQKKEIDHLTANAETVATKALPLMQAGFRRNELVNLVQTAAFFGNVRVRILDTQSQVLADSGQPAVGEEFVFSLPGGQIVGMLPADLEPGRLPRLFAENSEWILDSLPPGTVVTLVGRTYGPWGSQLSFFEGTIEQARLAHSKLAQAEAAAPRSEQVVRVPIGDPQDSVGMVELSAAADFGSEALEGARRAFLAAGGAAVLLAALFGLVMGQRLSAPLGGLTAAAHNMSAGDLSVRARVSGKDEVGQLAAGFNHMAEQLQSSFAQLAAERDALRRFIADASHELRTPITALKNFNTLLQVGVAEEPEARGEFLAESQAQIERMEWITQHLLDLSRLDAGLAGLELAEHDVGELMEGAGAPFRSIAAERGVVLAIEPPLPPVWLRCDRTRLELALSNLLDNALKFTPPGGSVTLRSQQTPEGVQIQVEDTGAGIDPEDLPHVFERFYRGRGRDAPGSGLGLSIVQSVVHAHAGKVTVDSAPGRGTVFTIVLL